MMFDIDPDQDDDRHPEDIAAAAFALTDTDDVLGTTPLATTAEQSAFDALNAHFGIEELGNWWEDE